MLKVVSDSPTALVSLIRGCRYSVQTLLLIAISFSLSSQETPGLAPSEVPNVLHYERRGDGEPVVLLQGANLSMQMWDAQVEFLSSEFDVVRYDVRGFGDSAPGDSPYQSHSDLRALLDHLGIERAHLVGLSLGGRIAVDFALTYPERVRSLVLAGPGLSGYAWDGESMRQSFEPISVARAEGNYLRAAELWLQTPFMAPAMENPELAQRLTELAHANSRIWAGENREVELSPPAVGRLSEITAPTLLLLGERDVADEHRIVAQLKRDVTNAQLHLFPEVGHVINLEAPDEFNRVVRIFLGQISAN